MHILKFSFEEKEARGRSRSGEVISGPEKADTKKQSFTETEAGGTKGSLSFVLIEDFGTQAI